MEALSTTQHVIFWFRRDLRLEDNTGLAAALASGMPVMPLFILDTRILEALPDRNDRRLHLIHTALRRMDAALRARGSGLRVLYGDPAEIWPRLLASPGLHAVYTNRDYEPYARDRDSAVAAACAARGIGFRTFKDQVILETDEVLTDAGKPYTVYTPYSRKWLAHFRPEMLTAAASGPDHPGFLRYDPPALPSLESIGFTPGTLEVPWSLNPELLRHYAAQRDFPGIEGTSRLSAALRFGTVSIREVLRQSLPHSPTFRNELIWREFFMQVLWHFRDRIEQGAFKPAYNRIPWRYDETEYSRWCDGMTGFPIVDAGMRELRETGHMHNRVRMITANFFCKYLLHDWRLGEAWFARHLLDYDLSANNGNWQWSAGTGCDAAPYFRIFNPATQAEKFDPQGLYLRRWLPEYGTTAYPRPMLDPAMARDRCLHTYKTALANPDTEA